MTDGYQRQGALLDVALELLPTPHGFGKDGQERRPGPTGNELGRAMTRLLPTPMARDGRPDGSQNVPSLKGSGTSLMKAALLLPTPTGSMGEKRAWPEVGRSERTNTGDDLAIAAAKLLPTPTASLANYSEEPEAWAQRSKHKGKRETIGDCSMPLPVALKRSTGASTNLPSDDGRPSSAGLHLNPLFVEWMMGAPIGWSDPACLLSATEFSSRPAGSADVESSSTPGSL